MSQWTRKVNEFDCSNLFLLPCLSLDADDGHQYASSRMGMEVVSDTVHDRLWIRRARQFARGVRCPCSFVSWTACTEGSCDFWWPSGYYILFTAGSERLYEARKVFDVGQGARDKWLSILCVTGFYIPNCRRTIWVGWTDVGHGKRAAAGGA